MEIVIGMVLGAAIVGLVWRFADPLNGALLRWLGLEPSLTAGATLAGAGRTLSLDPDGEGNEEERGRPEDQERPSPTHATNA